METAVASLTDHFNRFLEAAKEAHALHGRRGWLAVPMTLLMWLRLRRMRKEAEQALLEAIRGFAECFATMVEDWRAGKLVAPAAAEAGEARAEAEARVGPRRAQRSAPSAALTAPPDGGPDDWVMPGDDDAASMRPVAETEPLRPQAASAPRIPIGGRRSQPATRAIRHWIPAFAGMTGGQWLVEILRLPGTIVPRARPPPCMCLAPVP